MKKVLTLIIISFVASITFSCSDEEVLPNKEPQDKGVVHDPEDDF
ncbi:MAG: hypothetical protein AAF620_20195 [Bacteroidota bacterium]